LFKRFDEFDSFFPRLHWLWVFLRILRIFWRCKKVGIALFLFFQIFGRSHVLNDCAFTFSEINNWSSRWSLEGSLTSFIFQNDSLNYNLNMVVFIQLKVIELIKLFQLQSVSKCLCLAVFSQVEVCVCNLQLLFFAKDNDELTWLCNILL
jgi:hypothetical protein